MAETAINCPNCEALIKSGMFNQNSLIDNETKVQAANIFNDKKSEAYCDKCYNEAYYTSKKTWITSYDNAKEEFKNLLPNIIIITLQVPKDWDYTVVTMLSSQSVTGTGVVSEISSSFSDFFGLQSGNLNNKLKSGEDICKSRIRLEAFRLGANAIIGVDVDYAEVGGDKGMLMVCMSGTAIKLKNTDVLESSVAQNLEKLTNASQTIVRLKEYETLFI